MAIRGRGDRMDGVTCATRHCLRSAASRGLCVPPAWTKSPVSAPHPAPLPEPEWSPAQTVSVHTDYRSEYHPLNKVKKDSFKIPVETKMTKTKRHWLTCCC